MTKGQVVLLFMIGFIIAAGLRGLGVPEWGIVVVGVGIVVYAVLVLGFAYAVRKYNEGYEYPAFSEGEANDG